MARILQLRFETLYKQFISPITRFVFKKMGSDNPVIVDQIVSETFESAWIGYKSFKNKSSFFTWLCRIAINKVADYYRDQINRRSHFIVPSLKWLSQVESNDIPIVEKMALDDMRSKVNKVLDLLPEEKRRLLWFRYWKELSYRQISIIFKISPRAVEGKIYRAKKSFTKLFSSNA